MIGYVFRAMSRREDSDYVPSSVDGEGDLQMTTPSPGGGGGSASGSRVPPADDSAASDSVNRGRLPHIVPDRTGNG